MSPRRCLDCGAGLLHAGRKRCGPCGVVARVDALVAPLRMHDLRRTFATECVRSGVPITVVRDWLGHRDLQTTERYLGRYREDALVVAPTPAALDVFESPVVARATSAQ